MEYDPSTDTRELAAGAGMPEGPTAQVVLRRVGTVLILIALVILGRSLHEAIVSRGTLYDINLLVLIAGPGVLLRRGSLSEARVMAGISAFVLGLAAVLTLSTLTTPLDLTWTYLRLHPLGPVGEVPGLRLMDGASAQTYHRLHPLGPMGSTIKDAVVIATAAWIYFRLTSRVVLAAQEDAAGRQRPRLRRPLIWLLVGVALGLATIVRSVIDTRSEPYRAARAEFKQQLEPDLRFVVTEAYRWESAGPRGLTASAIVYNDHTYRRVQVRRDGSSPELADFQEEACTENYWPPPPPGHGSLKPIGFSL